MTIHTTLAYAMAQDQADPLSAFRTRFVIDDEQLLYMDGNSLGRLPRKTEELAQKLIAHQWGSRLIRSWGEEWLTLPERVGAKIAQLLGADHDEVIVADSTSVNLFKLIVAALRYQGRQGRSQILTDDLNFPSDVSIMQSAVDLCGATSTLSLVPSPDGIYGPVAALMQALSEQTALLALSHTVFKSGYTYDMSALTDAAHAQGALVLWDLSHSAGAVPLSLRASGVDLAVGCTYKYLNGGPGSPAFLYIRRALQEQLGNPLAGWMGQLDPFAFSLDYQPAAGLRRFLTGTPPILSLALIEPGVEMVLEAGIERLRARSEQQTAYLLALWEEELAPLGFTLHSPRETVYRGSHVSLGHVEGLRIDQALIQNMHVLPDFRAPDNLRLGLAPLYTSYQDIYHTVERLKRVVNEKLYQNYSNQPPSVT